VKGTEQQWSFKARPATVLKKKPFVPKHEKKYTEPKNIRLNTERRAQEWMVFELEMKEKFSQYEENTKMVIVLLYNIIYFYIELNLCLLYSRDKKK